MPQPPSTIAAATPDAQTIALARIGAVTGRGDAVSQWVNVHFNPATLQLQVSNELKDTKNNERKQYVAKASAKLTMELQFDTTGTGADVTETTKKLQAFVAPPVGQQDKSEVPPPVVLFEWGRIRFKGVAESYKETLDFFSANGVPLRALVNLTISRQDRVFDEAAAGAPANAGGVNDDLRDTSAPSAQDAANSGEAPAAARAVGAANGQESLRFGDGSPLTVSASVTLKPPAAFAAVGAGGGSGVSGGLGIGGGIGTGGGGIGIGDGISAGGSIGATAGLGITAGTGVSVGASAGISGLSRLSATEGAFAGLRVSAGAGRTTARVNTARLTPQVGSATLSTDRNASFSVGGKATVEGAAGLRADVTGRGGLRGKISFEGS